MQRVVNIWKDRAIHTEMLNFNEISCLPYNTYVQILLNVSLLHHVVSTECTCHGHINVG